MKVMMIPLAVGAVGMVCKGLGKRLKELDIRSRIEIIQTIVSLRLV